MRRLSYLPLLALITLAACKSQSFKKGDDGIEYKIISDGKGQLIEYGNLIQMHITQEYKGDIDTVLTDTRDFKPRIEAFDSLRTPPAYFKILRQIRKGDSLVIRLLTDSVFKKSPEGMPPYMKKGKYVYTTVKVVNIFTTPAQADSADKAEDVVGKPRLLKAQMDAIGKDMAAKKAQIDKDSKTIEEYLAKNNIKATRGNWGTFIVIHNEGTGPNISANDLVSINYTGKSLDSAITFDSNVDPKFQHVEPYTHPMNQPQVVIYGWTDALPHMKKGTKATIYVPSSLGYGEQGREPAIKPNQILVFDMEILDVMSEEAAAAKAQAEADAAQKKANEGEKKRLESLQKK